MEAFLLGVVLLAVIIGTPPRNGRAPISRQRGRPPSRTRGSRGEPRRSGRPRGRRRGSRAVTGVIRREMIRAEVALHRASMTSENLARNRREDAVRHANIRMNESEEDRRNRQHTEHARLASFREVAPEAPHDEDTENTALEEAFESHMASIIWRSCTVCLERVLQPRSAAYGDPCSKCLKHPLRYTAANNMDPSDVPLQLSTLSPTEVQLIASVHPVISVYKVKGQQYAYNGQVINFPQDVREFASKLPHSLRTLSSVLVVRRGTNERFSDFNVSRIKVYEALRWLRENNEFYKDVVIDRCNLDSLPEDGNVTNLLPSLAETGPSSETEDSEEAFETGVQHSGVPIAPAHNQSEDIEKGLADRLEERPVGWPETGSAAINEFT